MTNTLVSHYVVRPTEPDGDITEYRFGTANDVLDYIHDTLAGEYGYDDVDVDGIHALGFCPSVYQRRRNHGEKQCPGHTIATILIVADN